MEVETICRYGLPVCVDRLQQQRRLQGHRRQPARRRRRADGVRQGRALRQDDGGLRRRRRHTRPRPTSCRKGLTEAVASGKPTLINAVIDETAGTESGRITSLNPTARRRRNDPGPPTISSGTHDEQSTRRRPHPRLHARPVGADLHPAAGLVRRRRDQGREGRRGRRHARPAARHPRCRQPLLHDAQPQQALDHGQHQGPEGQGSRRPADQVVRRAGRELRARRARPHGLHLGAHPRRSTRA